MPCEAAAQQLLTQHPGRPKPFRCDAPLQRDVSGCAWRYVPVSAWPPDEVAGDALSEGEQRVLGMLRHAGRRRQWLAGRFFAKELLREVELPGGVALREIDIRTRRGDGKSDPPVVSIDGEKLPVRMSLAHTNRGLLVACAVEAGASIGVDLVDRSDVRPRALASWFTPAERRAIDLDSRDAVATQWALKEALYKAACIDESFAPARIEVVRADDGWRCWFFGRPLNTFRIDVRQIDGHIAAIFVG